MQEVDGEGNLRKLLSKEEISKITCRSTRDQLEVSKFKPIGINH